ncbi:MlaD family protein [Flavobacterium orientale]|uniref:Organic solvent ABC transporter substrate-binding protein n=1 Tax=Flavobacterium orientale TaxID=1756020 RepID=A0A916Y9E5_9FLAO|nr:MlaD family protein [Flavobacterium orientale]GGD36065.1 organic solvent ABC transporter substrate-binding protein [Flavobacterium orientale]
MKLTKEIKTAILVICSILLFIWGYSFLKGTDILTSYNTFYVEYNDVEGLASSAPVTINGLIIGKVKSISFSDKNNWKPIVELQINNDYEISKSSIARLYEPGLIGGKQIQIVPNTNDATLAKSGDILKGDVKAGLTDLVSERLTPLQEKIERMMVSADSLLIGLNEVLDENTKANLRNSVVKLNEVLTGFSETSSSINSMLAENKAKINSTTTNMEKTTANFSKISDSLAKANIGETVKKLETTLANVDKIMNEVQSGKGTMGKMFKDETLYNNFSKSSKELELLLQDLRLNPTRYVNVSLFGKKNKPYIAPVNDTISNKK